MGCSSVVLRMIKVQKMYTFLSSLIQYVAKGSSLAGIQAQNRKMKTKLQIRLVSVQREAVKEIQRIYSLMKIALYQRI